MNKEGNKITVEEFKQYLLIYSDFNIGAIGHSKLRGKEEFKTVICATETENLCIFEHDEYSTMFTVFISEPDKNNKNTCNKYIITFIACSRKWAMPNKNTFIIKPIETLIGKYLKDVSEKVIDPFANSCKMANITNDLDPSFATDYHMDAIDFLKMFDDNSVGMVLFDPPFSPRQVSEVYKKLGKTVNMQTTQASFWSKLKKEISRIVILDGIVISSGWNSGGIGKKYGFEIQEILLVPHGGWHNDTIITVDKKEK